MTGCSVGITDALGNTFNFTYDTLGRKMAMDDPDMGCWVYGYDLAGNLISQSGGNGGLVTGDGYYREYDGFGRLKLIRNGNSAASPLLEEYWYDPDGIRIKIKRNDTAQTTVYTPFKEMMQIRNTSGVYDYVYIYQEGTLVARQNPDGSTSFYHPDHLGSTTLLTDGNANAIENTTYEPFGAEISGGNLDVKGYTGQFDDEATEQYYYGARYYIPGRGQFGSGDPIIQNTYDPQALNHYSYVRNNPYIFVDPDGRVVFYVGAGGIGGISYGGGGSGGFAISFSDGKFEIGTYGSAGHGAITPTIGAGFEIGISVASDLADFSGESHDFNLDLGEFSSLGIGVSFPHAKGGTKWSKPSIEVTINPFDINLPIPVSSAAFDSVTKTKVLYSSKSSVKSTDSRNDALKSIDRKYAKITSTDRNYAQLLQKYLAEKRRAIKSSSSSSSVPSSSNDASQKCKKGDNPKC